MTTKRCRLRPGMRPETVHDERPEYIEMCIQSLLDELNQTMESVGLPLKVEETWASSRTWVFGKEFVCGSSLMQMALRRVARVQPDVHDVPDLSSSLSTIWSAGLAAAGKGISSLVSSLDCCVRSWETYLEFSKPSNPRKGFQSQEFQIAYCLLFSSVHGRTCDEPPSSA